MKTQQKQKQYKAPPACCLGRSEKCGPMKNKKRMNTIDSKTKQCTTSSPHPLQVPHARLYWVALVILFVFRVLFFSVEHFALCVYPSWGFRLLQSLPSPKTITGIAMQDCMSVHGLPNAPTPAAERTMSWNKSAVAGYEPVGVHC